MPIILYQNAQNILKINTITYNVIYERIDFGHIINNTKITFV